MTDQQLKYAQLQEEKRRNRAQEAFNLTNLSENARHNVMSEAIEQGKLSETQRSNRAQERVALGRLQEDSRHNIAYETETQRHNIAAESETSRANRAKEYETHRANKANEGINWKRANAEETNAATRQAELVQRQEEFGLQRDVYQQVTLPESQRKLEYQAAQIDEANARTDLFKQQTAESEAKELESQARTEYYKEQTDTEKGEAARRWIGTATDVFGTINNWRKQNADAAEKTAKTVKDVLAIATMVK